MGDGLFNQLVSALRRSKYFSQAFLTRMTYIGMGREIAELEAEGERKTRRISLRTFMNIVHAQAVFNNHDKEFKQYTMRVLKILMMKELPLEPKMFFKLMWSLCVLY